MLHVEQLHTHNLQGRHCVVMPIEMSLFCPKPAQLFRLVSHTCQVPCFDYCFTRKTQTTAVGEQTNNNQRLSAHLNSQGIRHETRGLRHETGGIKRGMGEG